MWVLVWAMRKVEEVKLGAYRELTLNITTLVTYIGWGNSKEVGFWHNMAVKYREEVLNWGQGRPWRITSDTGQAHLTTSQVTAAARRGGDTGKVTGGRAQARGGMKRREGELTLGGNYGESGTVRMTKS